MDFHMKEDDRMKTNVQRWENDRRNVFIVLCYESLLFGVELTFFEPTEYFYFKHILSTSQPMVFYSFSLALSILASLISALVIGYFIKQNELFCGTTLTLIISSVLGYVLYFTSNSPYLVIFGRFIAGFGKSTNVVSTVYLRKLFTEEQLDLKSAVLTNFVTIGSILGPCLTFLFLHIHTNLGLVYLNYGNAPGFYMALCKLVLLVLAFVFLKDIHGKNEEEHFMLDKPDCKMSLCCCCISNVQQSYTGLAESDSSYDLNEDLESPRETIPLFETLYDVTQCGSSLVFITVVIFGTCFKAINSLLPVESETYLRWGAKNMAALSLGNAIFGTLISVALVFFIHKTNHFVTLFAGVFGGIFTVTILAALPYCKSNIPVFTMLLTLLSLMNVLSSCLIGLSTRFLLIRLVDSRLRNTTDAIRACAQELSYVIGSFFIVVIQFDLFTSAVVMSFTLLLVVMSLIFNLNALIK